MIFKTDIFRATSPPPQVKEERGRDRSKKSSSRFSLKKIFNKMSSNSTTANAGAAKVEDKKKFFKDAEREMKKMKLNIIHPLDMNSDGVQVRNVFHVNNEMLY